MNDKKDWSIFGLKETKETGQLNAICDSELDPGLKLVGQLVKIE